MYDIPHLEFAMWAFDEAGLPYPKVPEISDRLASDQEMLDPASTETHTEDLAENESVITFDF